MLKGHGDDSYLYENKIIANFSSNVWQGNKTNLLKDYIFNKWDKIYSYPEVSAESLADNIALKNNIGADQVIVCNGATEAFYLIAQAYQSESSSIIVPTFAEYEDACSINKHRLEFFLWKDFSRDTIFETTLVWLCNPNNPTGEILLIDDIDYLLRKNKKSIFIIDEAYIDFTDSISSSIEILKNHENLIIVKSLTKNYSIPGLRLGYLISNSNLVRNIKFYKPPWTVNSIALEAGKFILDNEQLFLPPSSYYKSASLKFAQKLSKIPHIKVLPSKTNYFLVKLEQKSSFELKKYLINDFGILIRDASNFRSLDSTYIRLACQSEKENDLLIKALKQWSNSNI